MIEADADIVDNGTILQAMEIGFNTGNDINARLIEFAKKYSKKKIEYEPLAPPQSLVDEVETFIKSDLEKFVTEGRDGTHMASEIAIKEKVKDHYEAKIKAEEVEINFLMEA